MTLTPILTFVTRLLLALLEYILLAALLRLGPRPPGPEAQPLLWLLLPLLFFTFFLLCHILPSRLLWFFSFSRITFINKEGWWGCRGGCWCRCWSTWCPKNVSKRIKVHRAGLCEAVGEDEGALWRGEALLRGTHPQVVKKTHVRISGGNRRWSSRSRTGNARPKHAQDVSLLGQVVCGQGACRSQGLAGCRGHVRRLGRHAPEEVVHPGAVVSGGVARIGSTVWEDRGNSPSPGRGGEGACYLVTRKLVMEYCVCCPGTPRLAVLLGWHCPRDRHHRSARPMNEYDIETQCWISVTRKNWAFFYLAWPRLSVSVKLITNLSLFALSA